MVTPGSLAVGFGWSNGVALVFLRDYGGWASGEDEDQAG